MKTAGQDPGTQTHQVFISYAGEKGDSTTSDRQVADTICSTLEAKGIQCWIAHRDIMPGENWLNAIIDAVIESQLMIVVFSSNANESSWVLQEVTRAFRENKTIIPYRIENVSPLKGLRALDDRCQWMDAFTTPQEKHIERLVKIVSRHLGIEPAVPIKKEKLKENPSAGKVKPVVKDVESDNKKSKEWPDMPEDVNKVISKAHNVDKNKNGYWEAYYQDGIVMVYIPPGEFMMGQTAEEKKWLIDQIGEEDYNSYYINETPLHNIYLDGYWMGKYEVTFAQYDRYCKETKIEKSDDEGWGRENRPVINVSWTEAAAYCEWLSEKTGLQFKLPTEAQWEKAARGNDQRKYPWGSKEPGEDLANFGGNIGKTSPVGSYSAGASPYGLLDMAGNVWEWCSDWYKADYYKNSLLKNPIGSHSGSDRVVRGGSWYYYARYLRCADRFSVGPSGRGSFLGFRLRQDI